MIAISIANSVGSRRSSAPVVVVPVATAATGVGETSFTANWNAFAGANYYLLDVSLNSSFSSFVGSYQNYVTIGTSQLVSGLTPNTTYYYRLRAATGVDSDAAAFFSRVYTSGGVLSYTEVTATETLVYDMKTAGVWTAMKAVYPMIGASAAACAQNLKSSSFTGTFSSGWTFSSTGVTPNGTSAYMSTSLIPDTEFSTANDGNFGYYTRTDLVSAKVVMGANTSNRWFIDFPFGSTTIYPSINDGNGVTINPGFDKGFRQLSRNPTTLSQIQYLKNTTAYTVTQSSTNKPTNEVRLGMCQPSYYSSNEIAFAYVGDGQLTTTNQSNFYTAVQTFNQTLNRAVGPQVVSDADAQAYINRVYTAGGTLTNTEANAVNQLVIDMKGAGIWTAMKAVYPMVGSSASACAQNLKSSSFTGSFTSGWTFSSTGATPNGTSAYFNTNCNINGFSSLHYSFYSRTTNTSGREMGVEPGNAWDLIISLSNILYGRFGSSNVVIANGDSKGFYINTEAPTLSHKVFKNSSQLGATQAFGGSYPSQNVFIGAISQGGTPAYFSAKQTAFNSIGDGLTDTQAADFYTAVQIFNTTLGRQVAG